MKSLVTNLYSACAWRSRTVWLVLPALLVLCLAVAPRGQSKGYIDHKAPQLEGSWSVAVELDGQPLPIDALVSHTAGGVTLITDPNVFPIWPMTTPFHGTWARKGGHNFVFTFVVYQYDDTVNPPVLWKAIGKEKLTLDSANDSYEGQGTIDWFDAFNPTDLPVATVHTHTKATRINAE